MHDTIESHLKEKRLFKPRKDFAKHARIKNLEQYRRMYRESISRPEKFWAREADELLWRKSWRRVLEWNPPFAKWFVGGQLNLSENCLDRHLTTHRRNKAAIIWEGEPGEQRTLTYQQLHREVCRFANVVKRVIVFQRARNEILMEDGRDVWWHEELQHVDLDCPAAALDSEHPLYILYTSGSTGKPKGILHTTGGYLVGIYATTKYVFDLRDEDLFTYLVVA